MVSREQMQNKSTINAISSLSRSHTLCYVYSCSPLVCSKSRRKHFISFCRHPACVFYCRCILICCGKSEIGNHRMAKKKPTQVSQYTRRKEGRRNVSYYRNSLLMTFLHLLNLTIGYKYCID